MSSDSWRYENRGWPRSTDAWEDSDVFDLIEIKLLEQWIWTESWRHREGGSMWTYNVARIFKLGGFEWLKNCILTRNSSRSPNRSTRSGSMDNTETSQPSSNTQPNDCQTSTKTIRPGDLPILSRRTSQTKSSNTPESSQIQTSEIEMFYQCDWCGRYRLPDGTFTETKPEGFDSELPSSKICPDCLVKVEEGNQFCLKRGSENE